MNTENKTVEIAVSEDDLNVAISELYNSGSFELVGSDGTRVTLISKKNKE
jgi:hypothetical protein